MVILRDDSAGCPHPDTHPPRPARRPLRHPRHTQNITVIFNADLYGFQFCATEAYNVLSASAVDGSSAATTSGTGTIASGSVTTTSPGDLIYQYGSTLLL
jgi:hypothetical protein